MIEYKLTGLSYHSNWAFPPCRNITYPNKANKVSGCFCMKNLRLWRFLRRKVDGLLSVPARLLRRFNCLSFGHLMGLAAPEGGESVALG